MRITYSKAHLRRFVQSTLYKGPGFFAAQAGSPPVNHAELPSKYLTDLSRRIDPNERILYRDQIIGKVINILEKRKENSPVLVGETGVGKTAIAEELARRIRSGDLVIQDSVGRVRFDKSTRVIGLDLGGLQSLRTQPMLLDAEVKLITGFIEAQEREGNKIILWIDEIHLLPGEFSRLDQYLKEPTGRGALQILGATTESEYRQTFEQDKALARRFPDVRVPPLSVNQTVQLLRGVYTYYETVHHVRLHSPELVRDMIELADKFMRDRVLPGSAITLLDHSLSSVAKRQEIMANELIGRKKILIAALEEYSVRGTSAELEKRIGRLVEEILFLNDALSEEVAQGEKVATKEDILRAVSEISRRDLESIRSSTARKNLAELADRMKERVIGQDQAIDAIVQHIIRAKTGLKEPQKPICGVLLLGPTGVGKTEIARQLARLLFDSESEMLRYDMGEYQERHTVSSFLGSPPGYVGSLEGGGLINAIRRKPECVILLDEIEKAHPDIHMMLLGILADGVATSRTGTRGYFDRAVILMTSNAKREDLKRFHFPPEFLNRLDEIISCAMLFPEELQPIAELRLQELAKRMEAQGHRLEWTETAAKLVGKLGYSEEFGARPMKRVISKRIETEISRKILDHDHTELAPNQVLKFVLGAEGEEIKISQEVVTLPKPIRPVLGPQTKALLDQMQGRRDTLTTDELDEMLGISRLPADFAVEIINPQTSKITNMNPWITDAVQEETVNLLKTYLAKFGVVIAAGPSVRWLETCIGKAISSNLDSYLRREFGHTLAEFLEDPKITNGGRERLREVLREAQGKAVTVQFGQESDEGLVVFVCSESRMNARERLAMDAMLENVPGDEAAAMELYHDNLAQGIELDLDLLPIAADLNKHGLRMFYQRIEGKTGYILKIPAPRVKVFKIESGKGDGDFKQVAGFVEIHDNNPEKLTGVNDAKRVLDEFLATFPSHPERREMITDWLASFIQRAKQINLTAVFPHLNEGEPIAWEETRSKKVRVSWENNDGVISVKVECQDRLPAAFRYLKDVPDSPEAVVALYERDEENISLTDLMLLRQLKENNITFNVNIWNSTVFSLSFRVASKKGDPEVLRNALSQIRMDLPSGNLPELCRILAGIENPEGAENLRATVVDQIIQNFSVSDYHFDKVALLEALSEIYISGASVEKVRKFLAKNQAQYEGGQLFKTLLGKMNEIII